MGSARRVAARQASASPDAPTSEQEHEADHPGVREHLDVEVLDAPLAPFRREREVDDVREALARVGDVRLEDLRARGALPADADDRVVLRDPQPDVGEHRALRVGLDTDRRVRRRERRRTAGSPSSASPRTATTPPLTTPTTADECERLAAAGPEPTAGAEGERDGAEREAGCRRDRAREDQPDRRRRSGRRRRAACTACVSDRAIPTLPRRASAERRQRREVVVTEKRRLPPARAPRAEDVDARRTGAARPRPPRRTRGRAAPRTIVRSRALGARAAGPRTRAARTRRT